MNRISVFILAMVFGLIGVALASTVNTTDGQNFVVTDDGGLSTNYTMRQVNQIDTQADKQDTMAAQRYQAAHETSIIWDGVLQMAQNAEATWQANQVNAGS